MGWLDRLLGRQAARSTTRKTSADNPYVVRDPRLALMNLVGAEAQSLVDADATAIARHFASCVQPGSEVPQCDVLALYCRLDSNGRIAPSGRIVQRVIQDSQAPIILIAWPNPNEHYIAASKAGSFRFANVVMTLDRNGSAFSRFFEQLFRKMAAGTTMPLAWVELVPQAPGPWQKDVPSTIFVCGAGHIAFAPPG